MGTVKKRGIPVGKVFSNGFIGTNHECLNEAMTEQAFSVAYACYSGPFLPSFHDEFRFSRDVLADTYDRPSAVHVWSEGGGWTDDKGHTALNLVTEPPRPMLETPGPSAARIRAAKAFLQTCHDDLGAR